MTDSTLPPIDPVVDPDRVAGRLQDTPLSDVLESLIDAGVTGTLAIRHDGVVRGIFFKKGELVFVNSTAVEDRLGTILQRHGIISEAAVEAATRATCESGKRTGETLVEMGVLAPRQLFSGLQLQMQEILLSLFQWDTGTYQFRQEALPSQVVPIPIHLEEVVRKAVAQLSPTEP